jgi:hypothetical protein
MRWASLARFLSRPMRRYSSISDFPARETANCARPPPLTFCRSIFASIWPSRQRASPKGGAKSATGSAATKAHRYVAFAASTSSRRTAQPTLWSSAVAHLSSQRRRTSMSRIVSSSSTA